MEKNNEIEGIVRLLAERKLRQAIDALESFCYKHPELRLMARLEQIKDESSLMADYWQRGFKDVSLDTVYNRLIVHTYRLAADAAFFHSMAHDSYLASTYHRVRDNGRDEALINSAVAELEGFVSNMALLELEPEHVRDESKKALHVRHQSFLNDIFDFIWTSEQWNDGITETLRQLLLSPTIDATDQQLIVSAVTLGAMNIFDINKLRLLAETYKGNTDESVCQRALVGIVFAVDGGDARIFPDIVAIVDDLLRDEETCSALSEMQLQLLYCLSAESDTRKVQSEIMPEIIKNNNVHFTHNGIIEHEDDPMEDIINPEASDRRMEKIEEGFRKITDMQKAGADIYFGGFARMKSFPFFSTASNWFTVYYREHPAIASLYERKSDSDLVNNMIKTITFCNSDKYSFVIAFKNFIGRLPQELREMMSNGNVRAIDGMCVQDCEAPAYQRRIYLQDFYRFLRLFHARSSFRNPFLPQSGSGSHGYVFFANPLFSGTRLGTHFSSVVAGMMKRRFFSEVADVLANYADSDKDYLFYMLSGNMLMQHTDVALKHGCGEKSAACCFHFAMEAKPDDEKATFGYARALFNEGQYAKAAEAYERLLAMKPGCKRYELGLCVCLTNIGRYEEAQKTLYRLNYDSPDDDNVSRVLARSLVGAGKYEQAMKLYEQLGQDSEDIANRGYCEWFMGDIQSAIAHFAEYITKRYPDNDTETKRRHCQADIIDSESDFIRTHGIGETETHLMVDAIRDAIVR